MKWMICNFIWGLDEYVIMVAEGNLRLILVNEDETPVLKKDLKEWKGQPI